MFWKGFKTAGKRYISNLFIGLDHEPFIQEGKGQVLNISYMGVKWSTNKHECTIRWSELKQMVSGHKKREKSIYTWKIKKMIFENQETFVKKYVLFYLLFCCL